MSPSFLFWVLLCCSMTMGKEEEPEREHSYLLRIVFIKDTNWGSGVLRGDVMAHFLRRNEGVAEAVSLHKAQFVKRTTKTDFCICVKCSMSGPDTIRGLSRHCEKLGGRFVFDVIDHNKPMETLRACKSFVSLWLITNSYVEGVFRDYLKEEKQLPASVSGSPVTRVAILPHAHSMWYEPTYDCSRKPTIVGNTGSPNNRQSLIWEEALARNLSRYGLHLVNLNALIPDFDVPHEGNRWHQEQIHRPIDAIDLALIWPPEKATELALRWRPVTRLVTWWAHGIPTVFFPTQSYLEVAKEHDGVGKEWMARTEGELVAKLVQLANDREARCAYSRNALEASKDYSTQKTTEMLVTILRAHKDQTEWG